MRVLWIIVLCVGAVVRTCTGSAWLQDPPSRSAAWYYQVKTPVNYNFRNLNCGNEPVKIELDGSRNCGVCGDDSSLPVPRPNEWGGLYANPRVRTRYYEAGQVAELSLWNNLPGAPGFYEFRLCDEDDNQSQACLNKHLLTILDTNTTNMPVPMDQGFVMVHVQLPAGVTCNYCLLQWRFRKESIAGCDDNNWCGLGRGAQIEYYNCADVMIGAVGDPKPDFIQDPTYNAADYGSAYDIGETVTHTPDGTNIVGTTDTPTTTTDTPTTTTRQIIIITNPPPKTTTQSPSTTTTQNPVTTTTQNPVTTSRKAISTPGAERLVVNADGSGTGTVVLGDSVSASNNKHLLVLLSLLPLLGAYGLQNSRQTGYIPPSSPVTWSNAVPLYPIQFGSSPGFGNFVTGGFGLADSYSSKGGTYSSGGSYGKSYNTKTSGAYGAKPYHAITAFGAGRALGNGFPITNYQNTKVLNNNFANSQISDVVYYNQGAFGNGGSNSVQSPVVWNNNGVNINNGLTRFARSVTFPTGTSYQQTPNEYSNIGRAVQPLPINEYQSTQVSGYSRHNNKVPSQLPYPQRPPSNDYESSQTQGFSPQTNELPNRPITALPIPSVVQNNPVAPSFSDIQTPQNKVWLKNGIGNNQWPTNNGRNRGGNDQRNGGRIGNREMNSLILNGIGMGQRLPQPEVVTQRTLNIETGSQKTDDSFNRPGIESKARFQNSGPVQRFDAPEPQQRSFRGNVALLESNSPRITESGSRNSNSQLTTGGRRTQMKVNDWYRLLFGRLPQSARVI